MDRQISTEMQRIALEDTARWVMDHLRTTPAFEHPHELRDFALQSALAGSGLVCEFGVYSGRTINEIARQTRRKVYGFDWWKGLPEDWRTGFPGGHFSMVGLPAVASNVELIPGLFENSLPAFVAKLPAWERVAFVHMDCDLYSSTRTVLTALRGRLFSGAVIVFDEYFNYPGWREGEHKAWSEFVASRGVGFRYLGYCDTNEQVAVQII